MDTTEVHAGDNRGQFTKVTWMLTWRLTLLMLPWKGLDGSWPALLVSMVMSGIIVYIFGRTVVTWPLVRLVFKRRFPFPYKSLHPRAMRARDPLRPRRFNARGDAGPATVALDKATAPGTMTGYEPRDLDQIELQRSPWIVGDPGFGLDASHFDATSVSLGQAGERRFAQALQKANLIDNFQSFWSSAIPDRSALIPSREYDTDIDVVLFNGRVVYLVDLKNYKGGDVTYRTFGGKLVCRDNATGQPINVASKTSRNMQMAREIMATHLRHTPYRVETRIVFMPTNSGVGVLDQVRWPDRIRALYLPDFLDELSKSGSFDQTRDHSALSRALSGLVKRR